MYVRPTDRAGGGVLRFGISGKLWRGALLMYDRRSRSLWSQQSNQAIAGPLAGRELDVLASEVTDWQSWKAAHPTTTVVVKPRSTSFLEDWIDGRLLASIVLAMAAMVIYRWRRHHRS